MRKIAVPITVLTLIGFDQWLKLYTVANIRQGSKQVFIPDILSLTYLRNYGAAFSILQNQQWFFVILTVVLMTAALVYLIKHIDGSRLLLASLSLIIAGGVGNFIDRLRLGYVVDMFQTEFIDFAVFNIADSCLTVGVALLLVYLVREERHGVNH